MISCSAIDNRRQARRFRARHVAKIVLGPEAMIPCTIEDISTGGARIAVEGDMQLPDDFDIFIAAHDLQAHRARLCWRGGNSLGVSFMGPAEQNHAIPATAFSSGSFDAEFERVRVELERDGTSRYAPRLKGTA